MMGAVTPETCRVALQYINICILLHLVGFLLISFLLLCLPHHIPTCFMMMIVMIMMIIIIILVITINDTLLLTIVIR